MPGCFLRARAIGLMPMIDQVKNSFFLINYLDITIGSMFLS